MDKKYYELAKQVHETIKNDPKYDTGVRAFAQRICKFKKDPVMSWYLIYLKGLCSVLELKGMEEYQPLDRVDDVPIHYAITAKEVFVLTKGGIAYDNVYDTDETKFIHACLENYSRSAHAKPTRIVAYGKSIWFIDGIDPEKFKVVEIEKVSEQTEKIG